MCVPRSASSVCSILALCVSFVVGLSGQEKRDTPTPFDPSQWPLPATITGDQTTGGVYQHDPSIVRDSDGTYYSFGTHNLVAIGSAPNLLGPWTSIGSALSGESIINLPGRDDVWAPDVSLVNGVWHLYYSVSTFGSQTSAIGHATSTTLQPGSWTDLGLVIQSCADNSCPSPFNITNAIDANLFMDGDTPYLNYGSFYGDIWQLQLGSDLQTPVQSSPAAMISFDSVDSTHPEEGSFLHQHGSYYYLYISHGQCCGFNPSALPPAGDEYRIEVGRSESVHGPFLDYNGVDLNQGGGSIVYGSNNYVYAPGGHGVLVDADGTEILYYHYVDARAGYSDLTPMGWNPIQYVDDWPVLVPAPSS